MGFENMNPNIVPAETSSEELRKQEIKQGSSVASAEVGEGFEVAADKFAQDLVSAVSVRNVARLTIAGMSELGIAAEVYDGKEAMENLRNEFAQSSENLKEKFISALKQGLPISYELNNGVQETFDPEQYGFVATKEDLA